jgi:hypothetical protein
MKENTTSRKESKLTTGIIGATFLSAGIALGLGYSHVDKVQYNDQPVFNQNLQNNVNSIDRELSEVGEFLLFGGIGLLGISKVLSLKNSKFHAIESWSSSDLDKIKQNNFFHNSLSKTFAGRVPIVLASGVFLASMSSSIASSIINGPDIAVKNLTNSLGKTFVTEYSRDFTMTDGFISKKTEKKIISKADQNKIFAQPYIFNLGNLVYKNVNKTDLVVGVNNTLLDHYWSNSKNCNNIPIIIGNNSDIPNDSKLTINGYKAHVVNKQKNLSSMNRIGIIAPLSAVQACLEQGSQTVTGVALNASVEKTKGILKNFNKDAHISIVSERTIENNSNQFWGSNVLPLVSILEISSIALVLVFSTEDIKNQIINSRREWAIKEASGVGRNVIASTETIRALKNGVISSFVGNTAMAATTPFMVNTLVSGLRYSVSWDNMLVGFSVGIGGSLIGSLINIPRMKKLINVEENTRI